MQITTRKITMMLLLGVPLILGGCASTDDVKRAQSTADQALSSAQGAQQTASAAQSTAQAAQQTANQNSARLGTLEQQVQSLQQTDQAAKKHKHGGERG